jgi:hypothetical protein
MKKRCKRFERAKTLLAAWLAALKQIDNPMRRRAAIFRREQRPRRHIPILRIVK